MPSELNEKERAVVGRIRKARGTGMTLAQLSAACFPEQSDRKKANSWVRNSLRKPYRLGLIERVDRGRYAIAAVSGEVVRDLERMNPWWAKQPALPTPSERSELALAIHRQLVDRPSPILLVTGARGSGKTEAQLQVIEDLLARGVPAKRIFRIQFDALPSIKSLGREPILRLLDWYEKQFLGKTVNRVATTKGSVYLFLDEAQNLPAWDAQLKFLVDHVAALVVVSTSKKLKLGARAAAIASRLSVIDAAERARQPR